MAVSVLPLIALVLVTLHTGNAARTGPELTGDPDQAADHAPNQAARSGTALCAPDHIASASTHELNHVC